MDACVGIDWRGAADGSSVAYSYVYDAAGGEGSLTTIVEPERSVTLSYDLAARLIEETVHVNGVTAPLTTQYAYDANGDVSEVTYPSGLHLRLARDVATREVTDVINMADGTRYASQVVRFPGGPVKNVVLGNGLASTFDFNRRYEPRTIASGPVSLGYAMSPAGDVTSIGDYSQTLSGCQRNTVPAFQYDFLDRFTGAPGWLTYGYDANGNRTSEVVDGTSTTLIYFGGDDRVARRKTPSAPYPPYFDYHGFGYDFQGNVSAVAQFNLGGNTVKKALCLRHDPLGRVVLAGDVAPAFTGSQFFGTSTYWWSNPVCTQDSHVQTVTARFKYDSRGRRVARWLAATNEWTYVVSDAAGRPLSELVLASSPVPHWVPVRDYAWIEEQPLAQIEYPGPGGSAQGYPYYFHTDHIGLPRALTNSSGQMVWNTVARPFGDVVEKTTVDPLSGRVVVTNLRLPGQYDERLLSSVGLQGPYYNWNRWYLPGVGRYLELDPVALEGGMNDGYGPDWYTYANGNPERYIDPEGRTAAAGAAAGAAIGAPICGPPCMVVGAAIGAVAATAALAYGAAQILPICMAPPKPKPPEGPCDAQYQTDLATCRGVSRSRGGQAGARCYASAMDRYVACKAGNPLPPLDVWNN